jgi:hypothetical protein
MAGIAHSHRIPLHRTEINIFKEGGDGSGGGGGGGNSSSSFIGTWAAEAIHVCLPVRLYKVCC